MFEKLIPYDAAQLILAAYIQYYQQCKRINKRAKIRFEHRDWHGMHKDSRARLTLYRQLVGRTTEDLVALLGERANDRETWIDIKQLWRGWPWRYLHLEGTAAVFDTVKLLVELERQWRECPLASSRTNGKRSCSRSARELGVRPS